jgi:hypothetical protein
MSLRSPRRPPIFKQTDVAKALKAARSAGVNVNVEIRKDGSLLVIPVAVEGPTPSDADEIISRLR